MSSTMIVLSTLGPLLLLIVGTVVFMRRHNRKQRQKQRASFEAACGAQGFQVQFLLHQPDHMVALHADGRHIAWSDTQDAAAVHILPLQKTQDPILQVTRSGKQIQKITLRPPYAAGTKRPPDIVFYDRLQDSEARLAAAVAESEKWERAIQSH